MAKGGGDQGAELSEEFKKLSAGVQYEFQDYFNGSLVEVAKTSTKVLRIYYFRDWDLLGKVFKNPPRRKGAIDDFWWDTFERKLTGKLNAQKTISTTEDHVHALSELRKAKEKLNKLLAKGNVSQNTDVAGQNAEIARLTNELGTTKLQLSAETANRQANRQSYEEDLQRLRETFEGDRAAYKESLNIKMNNLTDELNAKEAENKNWKDAQDRALEEIKIRDNKIKHMQDLFAQSDDASASNDELYNKKSSEAAILNTQLWQLNDKYKALQITNETLEARLEKSEENNTGDLTGKLKAAEKRIKELTSALQEQPGVDDNSDGGGGEMADNIARLWESTENAENRLQRIENDQAEHVQFRDATREFVKNVESAVGDLENMARVDGVDVPPPYN